MPRLGVLEALSQAQADLRARGKVTVQHSDRGVKESTWLVCPKSQPVEGSQDKSSNRVGTWGLDCWVCKPHDAAISES